MTPEETAWGSLRSDLSFDSSLLFGGDVTLSHQRSGHTDTVATTRKPSVGAIALALPMLLFGSLIFLYGCDGVWEWRSESVTLIASSVVWILSGPATVGCALWLFGSLGRSRTALRIGGSAIVSSGVVLATVAATHVLPCSGAA